MFEEFTVRGAQIRYVHVSCIILVYGSHKFSSTVDGQAFFIVQIPDSIDVMEAIQKQVCQAYSGECM